MDCVAQTHTVLSRRASHDGIRVDPDNVTTTWHIWDITIHYVIRYRFDTKSRILGENTIR